MTQMTATLALMVGISIVGYIFGKYRGYQLGVWDSAQIIEYIFSYLEETDTYEDSEDA